MNHLLMKAGRGAFVFLFYVKFSSSTKCLLLVYEVNPELLNVERRIHNCIIVYKFLWFHFHLVEI